MADIIRAGALWGYCQLTKFMAHDAGRLLAEVGLTLADLDNPDAYLPRPSVVALLEKTAGQLDCPDFGLRLAEAQDIYVLGALAFAIRNAPDLQSAIATAGKYVHYQSTQSKLTIETGEQEARVIFNTARPETNGRQITEQSIGLFCRIIRQLTGDVARPTRVTFTHEPAAPLATYASRFGPAPQFNAEHNSVSMKSSDLALPLGSSNRQLQALVEAYLETHAPQPDADIERRTHEALTHVMRSGPAGIDDVADLLRMHPRTLQRRLMAKGATFERVRDNVRKSIAEFYLASDVVPLAEVAQLLGYANQSALTRSCVRWFGRTPLATRRELRRMREAS